METDTTTLYFMDVFAFMALYQIGDYLVHKYYYKKVNKIICEI